MKIIHTADLHLDSKLERHLNHTKASERRNELLLCFRNIVGFAAREGVEAILIAGDLFDVRDISQTARDAVISIVTNNPEIVFYYLRGNHDEGSFVEDFRSKAGSLPENFRIFTDEWKSYSQTGKDGAGVVISGAEITHRNNSVLPGQLSLNENDVNIVMLHGQESDSSGKPDGEVIPLRDYRGKGIDYMALGHIHAPKISDLDARGKYAYCGCPEGRGFDECGKRGFNVITIRGKSVSVEFVPFARRIVYDISVDVSNAAGDDDVIGLVREQAVADGVRPDDMLKARLRGNIPLDVSFHMDYIKSVLEQEFYIFRIKDETNPFIDYASFAADASLKGEFVRLLQEETANGNISASDSAKVIQTGIHLLVGRGKLQ